MNTDGGFLAAIDNVLFISRNGAGIERSSDFGSSWIPANQGLTNLYIQGIISNGTHLFAATNAGVFRSTNLGDIWSYVGPIQAYISEIYAADSILFAASATSVYASSDEGANWISASNGLANKNVRSFLKHNSFFFAATLEGVYRLENLANPWRESSVGIIATNVQAFATQGQYLFAEYNFGLARSSNFGLTWTPVDSASSMTSIYALAVLDSVLVAGTSNGAFLSRDYGDSWRGINVGLTNNFVVCLEAAPPRLFAGTYDGGMFLTTNNGLLWFQRNNGLGNLRARAVAVSTNAVFVGTDGGGIFKSTDDGASWNLALPNRTVEHLVASGDTVFATVGLLGIAFSSNAGSNWLSRNSGLPSNQIVYSLCRYGETIFASCSSGVYASTNSGSQWISIGNDFPNSPSSLFVHEPYLYASVSAHGAWRRALSEITTAVEQIGHSLPDAFVLEQNYPNPFNPKTTIRFTINSSAITSLEVFDIMGREVVILVDESLKPGIYQKTFDGSTLSSGVYCYRLQAGSFVQTKKLLLIK